MQLPGQGVYFAALFPRRVQDPVPEFATLGEGCIIRVGGAFGRDYAFLSARPVEVTDGEVAFHGGDNRCSPWEQPA